MVQSEMHIEFKDVKKITEKPKVYLAIQQMNSIVRSLRIKELKLQDHNYLFCNQIYSFDWMKCSPTSALMKRIPLQIHNPTYIENTISISKEKLVVSFKCIKIQKLEIRSHFLAVFFLMSKGVGTIISDHILFNAFGLIVNTPDGETRASTRTSCGETGIGSSNICVEYVNATSRGGCQPLFAVSSR